MMKIWIVNQYAIPPNRPGGTRHYYLAKELVKMGHEVTIFTSDVDYLSKEKVDNKDDFKVFDGVKFLFIKCLQYKKNGIRRAFNMLSFHNNFLRTVKKNKSELYKPDIIIGSSPNPFAALAALKVSKRFNIPFILEVRDLWPETLVEIGKMSPKNPFVLWLSYLEKKLYKKAEIIVTLLENIANDIQKKVRERKEIIWIPNGLDFDLVPDYTPPTDNSVFEVIYAGAHGIANNLNIVLDAAEILKQNTIKKRVIFRLIGDGPEKERLMKKAEERELTNVIFEDPVPKKEIYKKLQSSDACLMILKPTKLFEKGISPNKLFDYMSVGRPIIFSVSTTNKLIEKVDCGIVSEPGNPSDLATAIKKMAELPINQRELFGEKAYRYVKEKHDFENLALAFNKLLESVFKDKQKE